MQESLHRSKLLPILEDAKRSLRTNNKSGSNDSILIDTEHVIYIENGPNYHTYTFNIINNSDAANLKNLVLTPLPNGEYKQLIFSYNFSGRELERLRNNLPVDTKGKVSIYEVGNTTISQKACSYAEETIWHECSEGVHDRHNLNDWGNCKASIPPKVYTVGYWNCEPSGGGDSTGNPGGSGDNGPGGGTGGGIDCEADAFENPTDPTSTNGPCGGGVITEPNTGINVGPCIKTLRQLNNPKMKTALMTLKAQSTQNSEMGVKFKSDGTPSDMIPGGKHHLHFGDKGGYEGGYHNHTPLGIPMFSPPDINQLLSFALAQGNTGTPSNAYLGVVAPNGMHYVMHFNGSYSDALVTYDAEQIKKIIDEYIEAQINMITDIRYTDANGMNHVGVEKLFFDTLEKMGLSGKVSLQRITTENGVTKVTTMEKNGNTTTTTECSNT